MFYTKLDSTFPIGCVPFQVKALKKDEDLQRVQRQLEEMQVEKLKLQNRVMRLESQVLCKSSRLVPGSSESQVLCFIRYFVLYKLVGVHAPHNNQSSIGSLGRIFLLIRSQLLCEGSGLDLNCCVAVLDELFMFRGSLP